MKMVTVYQVLLLSAAPKRLRRRRAFAAFIKVIVLCVCKLRGRFCRCAALSVTEMSFGIRRMTSSTLSVAEIAFLLAQF